MRRFIALAVSVAALISTMSVAPVLAVDKPGCPEHKPIIVDATLRVANVADFGDPGHVWALDSFLERIRIWEVGTNFFCAQLDDVGTFTTFAGVSPAGTGTVSAGVVGSFSGRRFINVAGILSPEAPRSGHVGDFDAGCNQQGECQNFNYRFTRHYFTRVNTVQFGWFRAVYDGGSHGTFIQGTDGSSGDITG